MIKINSTFDKTNGSNNLDVSAAYDTNWVEGMSISQVTLSDIDKKKKVEFLIPAYVIHSQGYPSTSTLVFFLKKTEEEADPEYEGPTTLYWYRDMNGDKYFTFATDQAENTGLYNESLYETETLSELWTLYSNGSYPYIFGSEKTATLNVELIDTGIVLDHDLVYDVEEGYDMWCLKEVDLTIDLNKLFKCHMLDGYPLYIVEVNQIYTPTPEYNPEHEALKCIDTLSSYIDVIYDSTFDIKMALELSDTLMNSCSIPKDYLDRLLKVTALKLAADMDDVDMALELYKSLNVKVEPKVKPCGCHG